jgi:PAS domain S-box-containing protein
MESQTAENRGKDPYVEDIGFRAFFRFSPDAIFLVDADSGLVIDANPGAVRLLGRPPEQIKNVIFPEFFPPDQTAKIKDIFTRIAEKPEEEEAPPVEISITGGDGRRRGVEIQVGDLGLQGRNYFLGILTERRHREELGSALQRVRNEIWKMTTSADVQQILNAVRDNLQGMGIRFEDIGVNLIEEETSSLGIRFYTVDEDGDQYVNFDPKYPGIQVLLRIWREQQVAYRRDLKEEDPYGERSYIEKVKGGKIRSIIDIPFPQGTLALNSLEADAFSPNDIDVLQEMAQVLSEGFQRMEDFRTLEQRNRELEAEIIERERMEQELIHLERLRALGELSAAFCHNFNNILTGILGPAQMLKRSTEDPKVLQESEEIIAGSIRARDLVRRLNRAVRGEPGSSLYPVSVNEVLLRTLERARPRWKDQAEAQGIHIEVVTELEEVPAICGTQPELDDVFLNLLFNAVDAMPSGGTLTFRSQAAGDEVLLSITDTGIGMDEETKRKVFEPFFTTKMNVGTGLGLSTVHGTIQRWNGSIEVESLPGEGTTFFLRLPTWMEAE